MEQIAVLLIPILVLGLVGFLVFALLRWRFSVTRKVVEKYIQERNLDARIEKVGIPPLRLWLKNRKGDSWALLSFHDGSEKWLRIRGRLFSDDSYDFFS